MAVYYDRSGLIPEGGAARLDVRRIGVSMPTGVLHAKHVLLLVEDPGEPPTRRLVMLTTSANLTRGGWWENVEVGQVHQIHEGSKDLVREDLLGRDGLLARLERLDAAAHGDRQGRDAPHAGLHALRAFLKGSTQARRQARKDGRYHPRLWHGEQPLPEFLAQYARAGCRLEIISPFFSDVAETPTLRALIGALQPTAVRVLLPTRRRRGGQVQPGVLRRRAGAAQREVGQAAPELDGVRQRGGREQAAVRAREGVSGVLAERAHGADAGGLAQPDGCGAPRGEARQPRVGDAAGLQAPREAGLVARGRPGRAGGVPAQPAGGRAARCRAAGDTDVRLEVGSAALLLGGAAHGGPPGVLGVERGRAARAGRAAGAGRRGRRSTWRPRCCASGCARAPSWR